MDKQRQILLDVVQEAGSAIQNLQQVGLDIRKKANNDIVTQADLLANDILKSRLSAQFPDYGWLSEESVDDLGRLNSEYVWIVDPIDGTREFAQNIPEYAISVALVTKNEPILAAVYNPATQELFHAVKGKGAFLGTKPIHCDYSADEIILLASRSEYRRGEWERFNKQHKVIQKGSIAYKLAQVAAGQAHATFSLGPKNEWDIAAGVLLVAEAGGIVTNKNKETFFFNRQQDVQVNGIVATCSTISEYIFNIIN